MGETEIRLYLTVTSTFGTLCLQTESIEGKKTLEVSVLSFIVVEPIISSVRGGLRQYISQFSERNKRTLMVEVKEHGNQVLTATNCLSGDPSRHLFVIE